LKEIRLIRDKHTQASRGFCFVELNSLEEAKYVLESCNGLRLDGRAIRVAYTHRGNPNSAIAVEQAQWISEMQHYFDSTYSWDGSATTPNVNNTAFPDVVDIINSGDISQFVYDSTSGYHYHAASGLYYHSQANYYWDSNTGTYYNLDPQTQKFIPYEKEKKEDKKDEKPKKTKKEAGKSTATILGKKMSKEIQKWSHTKSHVEESNNEEHSADNLRELEEKVAEPTPLLNVCLLCKRQFPSQEALKKHEELSKLHKTNMELEKQRQTEAKEKEKKYGKFKEISLEEEEETVQNVNPLNEFNKGAQLMQKMGWKQGEGIGRNTSVVTAPIEVEIRTERAGLGLFDSTEQNAIRAGDKFVDAVKKGQELGGIC